MTKTKCVERLRAIIKENSSRDARQPESAPSRRAGRPVTARKKLIAAGYHVMSRNGLDGSSIGEIVERANVGVGSFYKHFATKEELAKAVFAERAEDLGSTLEQLAVGSKNMAAATCFAYRRLIEEIVSDKVWASFIVQLEPSMRMLDMLLRPHARIGIRAGVERGLLIVDDIETGITSFNGAMIAVARSLLAGDITSAQAHRSAVFALRMFGVNEAEAARLSHLTMAELRSEVDYEFPDS